MKAKQTDALEGLVLAGAHMANICFNLGQNRSEIDRRTRDVMLECQKSWDRALLTYRRQESNPPTKRGRNRKA